MKRIWLIIIALAFAGCFKKDVPVDPYPRGDAREVTIEIGEGYANQVFYSFNANEVVKTVRKVDWDIALSSEPGSRVVRINTSRGMYAAEVNGKSFSEIKDTSGLEFRWDVSSGNPDSIAIHLTEDTGQFVINMGYGENFELLGFRKISFHYSDDSLHFKWSNLDNSSYGEGSIGKDTLYNHLHFSLLHASPITIEPPKKSYDIFFTQYIYYFEEEDMPYLVSGVLLNPFHTFATSQDEISFEDYSAEDLDESMLTDKGDIIGYDWKWYNLQEGLYLVDPKTIYTIKSSDGFLYKMHFIDYYNNQGISGFPLMQQQRM